jgi:hypothetical protein
MRSEYVFAAAREVGNRFLLCRVASASARRLHQGSMQSSETINKSLKLIAGDGRKGQETLVSCDDGPSQAGTTAGEAETRSAVTDKM